ncbi:MAG TPA: DNA repair protein RadC, partial [Fimbriimonadaceae bacterium]|nr:DNA repair protein RadC [Fimbriimonadaceae bacterium]
MPIRAETAVHRLHKIGVRGASPVDLLSVGLSRREEDVELTERAARDILQRVGNIRALGELSPHELAQLGGLDTFESLRAQALLELGRRIGGAGKGERPDVDSAQEIVDHLDYLRDEKREHFCAVLLDAKNRIMRVSTIHIGTLTMSVVGPREVFREAIREGASSIIVAHNHPSGDPTPSPEDVQVTDQLVAVGKTLDIPVLDHIILGERHYVSFRERG